MGRVLAAQTVVTGIVTGVPALSEAQIVTFLEAVMRLAREVAELRLSMSRAAL